MFIQPSICVSFFNCIFSITIYPSFVLFHLHTLSYDQETVGNHPTVAHVYDSFVFFAWFLNTPAARTILLLSIYVSVSILLVSSVCPLTSTYEWNHMVFVFLWLDNFTYCSIMFSRSMYAVAKGKIFLLPMAEWYPLCKCTVVVLSTHLLMNTGAASKSWQL